jgi:hypothetical protein
MWLGAWLIAAPPTFGFKGIFAWNDVLSGLLLILFGFFSLPRKNIWAPWASCMMGVWLQFAPLLFWAPTAAIYLNDTLIGVFAIVFSLLVPDVPGRLPDSGHSIPPGWSYNPSAWPQRFPIIILGTIAWFISRYLGAFQLGYIDAVWDPFFGTGALHVITSKISKDFPVSDAGLGAISYTLDVLLAAQGSEQRWRATPWMVLLFGVVVVPGSLISILLIILQPIAVGFWCGPCLFIALCMLAMVVFAVDEVVASIQFLRLKKERGKSVWKVFWKGDECREAIQDLRSPPLDGSKLELLKSMRWGATLPWNLALSALLGASLMMAPWVFHLTGLTADIDHAVGALLVVVSIISMAEVIRSWRYLNVFLGAIIVFSYFWPGSTPYHLLVGALLIGLSLRAGIIKEVSS